jgi:hypothetical protein
LSAVTPRLDERGLRGGPATVTFGVMDDRRQPSESYDPPRLTELGEFSTLTKSVPVGKVTGGPDAFGLIGRGHLTNTSA